MKVKVKYKIPDYFKYWIYKQKTIEIEYEKVKSDFWKIPGAYDIDKVEEEVKKTLANGELLVNYCVLNKWSR